MMSSTPTRSFADAQASPNLGPSSSPTISYALCVGRPASAGMCNSKAYPAPDFGRKITNPQRSGRMTNSEHITMDGEEVKLLEKYEQKFGETPPIAFIDPETSKKMMRKALRDDLPFNEKRQRGASRKGPTPNTGA
jgi:hypothetical protein